MTFDVATMLTIPVFRAMDVDSDGRVLAGTDESGSMQIIEISADGDITALTALPGACGGRYLPLGWLRFRGSDGKPVPA